MWRASLVYCVARTIFLLQSGGCLRASTGRRWGRKECIGLGIGRLAELCIEPGRASGRAGRTGNRYRAERMHPLVYAREQSVHRMRPREKEANVGEGENVCTIVEVSTSMSTGYKFGPIHRLRFTYVSQNYIPQFSRGLLSTWGGLRDS
jgi:hypothetical protein